MFGLFCLCWFFVSLCLFLSVSHENHCFPCKSSVLGLMLIQSLFLILVSGSCFLLLFCFLFQDVPLFLFMLVVLSWLNHKVRFVLICILFSCSVLWVLGFVLSVLGLVDWACCRWLCALPLGAPSSKPPAPLPTSQQARLNQNYWGWGLESLLKEGVGPWGWALLLIGLLLGGWVVFLWREVWGSLFGLMEGYGSLCSVRGSCLVVLFQWLFLFCWVLGPSCPLWFSFPPRPSLCPGFRRGRVRVDRGGGLEKGSLAGEVGGKGVFVFFCLGFVFVFLFVFVLSLCFLGLFLFCSLCLLEWSRCCSCFVMFGLFGLCYFLFLCACFFWLSWKSLFSLQI